MKRLRRPAALLLLVGFATGIVFWGGLHTGLTWTNSEKFCIGCHEMHDNVYLEYQQTIHYTNRTGVRAVCADCHVPREWGPMLVRKLKASRELWGKLTGSIDTREKFEAKRLTLARREWQRMLSNDSLECRNCHSLASMDKARQASRAAGQHALAREEGITCIVCHQGIAHQLPANMTDTDYLEPTRPLQPDAAPSTNGVTTTPLATERLLSTAPPAPASATEAPAPPTGSAIDWGDVEATEIVLLYPGIAHLGWLTGDVREGRWRHGGGWAFKNGETCYACHFDETHRMGERIVTGSKLEPSPIPGKAASIPVRVQAAHDGERLHLRFRWKQPQSAEGEPMDPDNAVKLAFMLDAGKVDTAERNGCWASCHADSRTMPAGDPERTKYVANGDLESGVFYDLVQWRSGENRGLDGHVAESRVMKGGQALLEATGERDGDEWTVTFTRNFKGATGDLSLEVGRVYNFGFAIHDGHAAGRFHHVSLGYTLGIDTEALITARRH